MRKLITATQPPDFTLAPLLTDGRDSLACRDIDGMEKAVLKRIDLYYGGTPWHQTSHKAEDIFALEESSLYTWPPLEQLLEAEFAIWTKGSRRARRLTIRFPDTVTAHPARDPDASAADQQFWRMVRAWMEKRRFMTPQPHGDRAPLLA